MKRKILIGISLVGLLVACHNNFNHSDSSKRSAHHQSCVNCKASIVNYGQNNANWIEKMKSLNYGGNTKLRILQLGDSHTAGDYFSDQVRHRLQAVFGNGGSGWVYPAKVAGQRTAQISYKDSWQVITSRRNEGDFPLGGVIAQQGGSEKIAELGLLDGQNGQYEITLSVKANNSTSPLLIKDKQGQQLAISPEQAKDWTYIKWNGGLPLSYQSQRNNNWSLGHINIENNRPGVIYSSMGINGSQLSHWTKWRANWQEELAQTKADLIVLAYGTNEAFNNNINIEETKNYWIQQISKIRSVLPQAGILIIGAPESLRNNIGVCGERPQKLYAVQQMQKEVAQQTGSLYWSWQDAMGGECNMNLWVAQSLAVKDGVHFSAAGYKAAADQLADALIQLAR